MTFKEFEERRGARRSGEGEAGETEVTGNELRVTGGEANECLDFVENLYMKKL